MLMTYFDLLSTLRMNAGILSRLGEGVLVYTQTNGLEKLKLNDKVHEGVKWAWYALGEKVVKVKVCTVDAPAPYEFFVFAEFQEIRFGEIL